VAGIFIRHLGRHYAFIADTDEFPWLFQIRQGYAGIVYIFVVTDDGDGVKNYQPALIGFDGGAARADFAPAEAALVLSHKETLVTPEFQVGTLRDPDFRKDIWTLEGSEEAVDFLGEKDCVAETYAGDEAFEFELPHILR